MVRASAESLLGIVNDLLDFSRIEAGRLDLHPVAFRLRDCLSETLRMLAPRAHERGLELLCLVPDDVPDPLVGDPVRLRQVLVNLIGNAIKFTPSGEVALLVASQNVALADGARPKSVRLQFTIDDTGIGIPPDKLDLIFHPFEQADDSLRRQHQGTGLGLAIASRLVERMGGRITVQSEVGKGSQFCFAIELPLQELSKPPPPLLESGRVLVIDGVARERKFVVELLRAWGLEAVEADETSEALRVWDVSEFDVVLLDAHLADCAVAAFVRRLRERRPRAAIVLLLRTTDRPEWIEQCRSAGATGFLTRPILPPELRSALGRGLRDERAPRAALPLTSARRLRVLVAEDNAVNQALIEALLRRWGHDVVVVGDGRQVLDALEHQTFDIVLMDVHMPEIDGFEATAMLRERERERSSPRLPVVALTAYAMQGDRERCIQAGMDEYLAKPVRAVELFAVLERLGLADSTVGCKETPPPTALAPSILEGVPDEALLDLPQLRNRLGHDDALIRRIVGLFLDKSASWLADIRTAVHNRDARQLERAAHALKGSLANLTAHHGAEAAETLERLGRAGRLDQAADALARLDAVMRRLHALLTSLLDPASDSTPSVVPSPEG
jgi:CheY-like chemotaxis protein/HPt (histidine-containing phosphotransfer) domain-containing protein